MSVFDLAIEHWHTPLHACIKEKCTSYDASVTHCL